MRPGTHSGIPFLAWHVRCRLPLRFTKFEFPGLTWELVGMSWNWLNQVNQSGGYLSTSHMALPRKCEAFRLTSYSNAYQQVKLRCFWCWVILMKSCCLDSGLCALLKRSTELIYMGPSAKAARKDYTHKGSTIQGRQENAEGRGREWANMENEVKNIGKWG